MLITFALTEHKRYNDERMPPTTPPTSPELIPASSAPTPQPAPNPPRYKTWRQIARRADSIGGVVVLLAVVLMVGGAAGFGLSLLHKGNTVKTPTVETLSQSQLSQLSTIGNNLGTSGQVLNIGADTLFRGKATVSGNLSVGGTFSANGPVTLSQLNITGSSALSGLSVGSNLSVNGATTLNDAVTVQKLLAVNGTLSVNGTANVNTLAATTITVKNISISGPLTIGHLITQGPTPTASAGGAIGGGGTISVSGNDTAGTINMNTGGYGGGTLMTVTFRAAYGAAPHILLSPRSGLAALAAIYVLPSTTGFTVVAASGGGAGTMTFDYFVAQ